MMACSPMRSQIYHNNKPVAIFDIYHSIKDELPMEEKHRQNSVKCSPTGRAVEPQL
jgi:hypothetical protein